MQLKEVLETIETTISSLIVKEATEAVIKIISKQQDESEKQSMATFESLSTQLSMISTTLLPQAPRASLATNQPSSPESAQPQPHAPLQPSVQNHRVSPHQCNMCGKTFGSSRALINHTRTYHEPKP